MHVATRFSANRILYGFEPAAPLDHALSHLQDNKVVGVESMLSERHTL